MSKLINCKNIEKSYIHGYPGNKTAIEEHTGVCLECAEKYRLYKALMGDQPLKCVMVQET